MKNFKKMMAIALSAIMLSSIPGMGLLGGIVAFAFEVTVVDEVVYEEVYDIVDDYVYDVVDDYVYDIVDEFVYDTEINEEIFTLSIGQNTASVFGVVKENDVQPIIRNDRTMLPARFVAENLGATVSWDAANRVVIIQGKDIEIKLTIDSAVATVNGAEEMLDSPAFIENDRTYTPVRFIAEKLGSTVEWDAATQTVIMSKPVQLSAPEQPSEPDPTPANPTSYGTLQLNNFDFWYEVGGEIVEYNEGSVGSMNLSIQVAGPSNVCDVLIASWSEEPFAEEEIQSEIDRMVKIWKEAGFKVDEMPVPFESIMSHPVDQDELGKTMYVLLIGLDSNCDAAGYAVVEEYIG